MSDTPLPPSDTLPVGAHAQPMGESDQDQASKFAALVRNMLEEHEKKEFAALSSLRAVIDLLVQDVRGLHLQSAAHGADIAQLRIRIGKAEIDILDLKQMVDDLANR